MVAIYTAIKKDFIVKRVIRVTALFLVYSASVNYALAADESILTDGFESPPAAAIITGFTASPDPITVEGTTTISWTTENAKTCTPSDGTGGWDTENITLHDGNAEITIAEAGTHTFSLTCQGAIGDPAVAQTTVTANPVVTACDPSPLSGNTVHWADFWGVAFPLPVYDQEETPVLRKGYLAIEFNTSDITANGAFVTVGLTKTSGVRLGAVSECPGDFRVVSECTHKWGVGGGFGWATDGTPGACQLDSEKTYYFNMTFTDGLDPLSSSCTSFVCNVLLRHTSR